MNNYGDCLLNFLYLNLPSKEVFLDLLSTTDCLNLRLLCSSLRAVLDPFIERNDSYVFRIPEGAPMMKTLSPCNLVMLVSSTGPLPPNLVKLRLLDDYLSPSITLPEFPNSLRQLILPDRFDIPLNEYKFPPKLTHLDTGRDFNHPINDVTLPPTLTHLTTGFFFNQRLDRPPPSLTHLTTGNYFLPENLPSTIKHLSNPLKCNVLLVDDNELNRKVYQAFLKRMAIGLKCEIVEAVDGAAGVEAFQNAVEQSMNFDVILMDWSMPVMDGCDATREIRKLEKVQHLEPATIIGLHMCDMDTFAEADMCKPVRIQAAREMIMKWLRGGYAKEAKQKKLLQETIAAKSANEVSSSQ